MIRPTHGTCAPTSEIIRLNTENKLKPALYAAAMGLERSNFGLGRLVIL